MSKEIGPITTTSAPAMTAERGSLGIPTPTQESRSSYQPMFSISIKGALSKIESKFDGNFFSQDRVAPPRDPKVEAILYQRSSTESTSKALKPETSGLQNKVAISESDGIAPKNQFEYLYKRPEGQLDSERAEDKKNSVEESKAKVDEEVIAQAKEEQVKIEQETHGEKAANPSTWSAKLLHLAEKREVAKQKAQTRESQEGKTDDNPATNLNPFVNKFQGRVASLQRTQAIQSPQSALAPDRIQALEERVATLTKERSTTDVIEQEAVVKEIQEKATPEVGRLILDHQENTRSTSLTPEQAQLEIATKLQDGAKVARSMIEILKKQGVEPQVARQTAIERTTQTLVKALKEKELDQFLRSDEEPRSQSDIVALKPKIEVKEYVDDEGHQIKETVTTDEFNIVTIEREEIIAERDEETDAKRVELATHISSQLLEKSRGGGGDSIHTLEVAGLMPEGPGEALASYIRKQLNLMLDSEEQYDRFLEVLAGVGYITNEHEAAQAARYATDLAPAVRLTRKLTTEKVLPTDEQRASSKGSNFSFN